MIESHIREHNNKIQNSVHGGIFGIAISAIVAESKSSITLRSTNNYLSKNSDESSDECSATDGDDQGRDGMSQVRKIGCSVRASSHYIKTFWNKGRI